MKDEELRKQAWDFLQVQAAQRLTTFNFYIIICSAILAILFGRSETIANNKPIAFFLFFLIALLSATFWKLDRRNAFLIKSAEDALKEFEKQAKCYSPAASSPALSLRFLREEHETCQHNAKYGPRHWRHMYTYTECFRIIFTTFALIGIFGAAMTLLNITL